MLADVQTRRIALAQIAPRLGSLEVNLATHHDLLAKAREDGADLVVFPELGLTGYQLQDLASEVAMRLDDPRLATLAGATRGLSAVVSFVEESADHRLFIAAALLEDGEMRHVHRKLYLPTYGLFDERRFFAAGDVLRSVPSRLGIGLGIGVCEDFWHLSVPQLLALDGAQILINVSSSPGRDLAATNEVGLGTATSWRTLMRTYAQLTTSFVIFCNRVGVDESISFWGGSEVIAPSGQAIFSAPLYDEGLYMVDVPTADIRRERIALAAAARRTARTPGPGAEPDRRRTLRPGGRHECRRRGRAWLRPVADRGAVPADRVRGPRQAGASPEGARRGRHTTSSHGGPRHVTATEPSAELVPPFDLPTELAIDTDIARRVIGEFIRGQLEQAGFERAVLGLSGGIDSAVVGYLVAEAIGPERLLAVMMPYRTSSPASRADAESVIAALGCTSDLVDISPMVDGYFGSDTAPGSEGSDVAAATPLRRGNFAARMRMSVLYDRSVTWGGLVVGTGNKTESLIGYTTLFGDSASAFNPIGDLYKSQIRQLAVALGVPDAIVRKPPTADLWPGQTDEIEGGFSYPVLDRLLFWRIDKRRSMEEMAELGFERALVERVDRLVAGSEFKRQVPPIAKLGPRTAGVDYLYPRRRPGSARG